MAAPTPVGARFAGLMVLLPFLALGWYFLSFLAPMWRWQNFDEENLARKNGLTLKQIQRNYEVIVRHASRGDGDPCPWQIISSTPEFDGFGNPEFNTEKKTMVRCSLINDRSGEGPSSLLLGSGAAQDRYFKATVWRLPKGSFQFNPHRPVVLYQGGTFEKLTRTEVFLWEMNLKGIGDLAWSNDDAEIDDGYIAPGSAAE